VERAEGSDILQNRVMGSTSRASDIVFLEAAGDGIEASKIRSGRVVAAHELCHSATCDTVRRRQLQ